MNSCSLFLNLGDIATTRSSCRASLKLFRSFPLESIESFQALETNSLYIKASMGIAMTTSGGADSEILLQHADAALELAQHHGKNNYEIYQAIATRSRSQSIAVRKYPRSRLCGVEQIVSLLIPMVAQLEVASYYYITKLK